MKRKKSLVCTLLFVVSSVFPVYADEQRSWLQSTLQFCTKPTLIVSALGALGAAYLYSCIKKIDDCITTVGKNNYYDGVFTGEFDDTLSFARANKEYVYPAVSHEEHQFVIPEGQSITIANTIGSITVFEHARDEIIVEITKQAFCDDALDAITVDIKETKDGVVVNTQHPQPLATVVTEAKTKFPVLNKFFTHNVLVQSTRVDYLILIPDRAITLDLSTVVGDIGVYAGRGAVRAYSQYGDCYVSE